MGARIRNHSVNTVLHITLTHTTQCITHITQYHYATKLSPFPSYYTRCVSVGEVPGVPHPHTPQTAPSWSRLPRRPPNPRGAPAGPRETTTCSARRNGCLVSAADTGRSCSLRHIYTYRRLPVRPLACGPWSFGKGYRPSRRPLPGSGRQNEGVCGCAGIVHTVYRLKLFSSNWPKKWRASFFLHEVGDCMTLLNVSALP